MSIKVLANLRSSLATSSFSQFIKTVSGFGFDCYHYYDKTDNCYIMSYKLKNPILDNQETLYIFFQYVDSDYKNLKIFNRLEEAMDFRDKHFKYGHIFGMKQDTYYESLLNFEYINIQELN